MQVRHYKELICWQRAMDLAVAVYGATAKYPADERFGLTAQSRGAAVSVPSNIAEGQSLGNKEFIHFLRVANGSRQELETQLMLAQRLKYLDPDTAGKLLELSGEVGRIVSGLLKSLSLTTGH